MNDENSFGGRATERPAGELPAVEREQPDPMLQISTGRLGAGGLTLVALAIAVVLGLVFYGLNSPQKEQNAAEAPPPASGSSHPAHGGNSGAPTPGAPRSARSGNG